MGLIAGIYSRNQNNISDKLYKMTIKLSHRGNSKYFVIYKGQNGWNSFLCENPKEILTLNTAFGIVGRHLILDEKNDKIPYSDCYGKNILILDGRIFNQNQILDALKESHQEISKNSGIIIHFIEELKNKKAEIKNIFKRLFEIIDGMFAAILILGKKVFLFRDLQGIKPLYLYSCPNYTAFASEKKAFWIANLKKHIIPLLPGNAVQLTEKGYRSIYIEKFKNLAFDNLSFEKCSEKLLRLLNDSILTSMPTNQFYLLLSGGIDSTILAALLKENNANFKSLVIGSKKSKDLIAAEEAADLLNLRLEVLNFETEDLIENLAKLIYSVESRDEKKLNIAFPIFYGSKYALNKNCRSLIAGQGADEIFGGYERYEIKFKEDPKLFQKMSINDVKELYQENLQRDDAVSMANGVELRLPYLNKRFMEFSLGIPPSFKIRPPIRKYILREIGNKLGLSENIIQKRKKALQFSSGSYDILKKLAKQYGFTKNFALKHGFFSPTQLFIDSIAYFLGFTDIDPKTIKFAKKNPIDWPESFLKYKKIVNRLN